MNLRSSSSKLLFQTKTNKSVFIVAIVSILCFIISFFIRLLYNIQQNKCDKVMSLRPSPSKGNRANSSSPRSFWKDGYDDNEDDDIHTASASPNATELSIVPRDHHGKKMPTRKNNYRLSNQHIIIVGTLLLIGAVSLLSVRRDNQSIASLRGVDPVNVRRQTVYDGPQTIKGSGGGSITTASIYNHSQLAHHFSDGDHNNPWSQPSRLTQQEEGLQQQHQQKQQQEELVQQKHSINPFALSPGELPGYTGWARPEQTLAGYFEITSSSSYSSSLHKITSGEKYSLLLTCNHNSTQNNVNGNSNDGDSEEPPYACPSNGGTLFYIRAYGPSVITGNVIDHGNTSYSMELYPVDPGDYTVEVVVTFSSPLEFEEFPINRAKGGNAANKSVSNGTKGDMMEEAEEEEPGYEGYLVAGFPLLLHVDPAPHYLPSTTALSTQEKPLCNLAQITESSPQSSLAKGHWQIIDHVARASHQPITPDETSVSLDGYRMGLNSVGVRMQYVFEECELLRIRDIFGGVVDGTGHVVEKCLRDVGYESSSSTGPEKSFAHGDVGIIQGANASAVDRAIESSRNENGHFKGIHVIFIGDSVMKLEMGFFNKLVTNPQDRSLFQGFNVTFLNTNGGIHATMSHVMSSLNEIQEREKDQSKKVILFNTGLHDVDILCCSIRSRARNATDEISDGKSCVDSYREALTEIVQFVETYPAQVKVFRSTTAGWQKYGNYGFSWPATELQPMSRSPHLAHHFNTIAYDIIQKQTSSILIADGYWVTLPRPDHTQSSDQNQIGKHLVHPGYEVLSVFARRWLMMIIWGLCGDVLLS